MPASNVTTTYIGHATTLIEAAGVNILTDPVFSPRVAFRKRNGGLKYNPADLPELSAILISHAHIDHLNFESFNYVKTTVPIVVPEGSGKHVGKFLPNPIIELSAWIEHSFGKSLKLHAIPAKHPSSLLCPHHYSNALSYVIQAGGKTMFFSGDTAYHQHFHDVGKRYSIDLALLSIGCYKPAFFMRHYHMDPAEAVQAFFDLKAKIMIPIHWGTFRLSLEKPDEPVEWLRRAASERQITEKVKILNPGSSYELE